MAILTAVTQAAAVVTDVEFVSPTAGLFFKPGKSARYVCKNFLVGYHSNRRTLHLLLVRQPQSSGLIVTTFDAVKKYRDMTLTPESLRLLILPNAGGNSVVSEVLSYEYMRKCYGACLLKTEMEVEYFPMGGSITDYVMRVFDRTVAVSVTRAVRFDGDFTVGDGVRLLVKKLGGIAQANRNSLEKWNRHVLHVWASGQQAAESVAAAFTRLPQEVRGNTVVVLTCVRNCAEIFTNQR